jgi:hypothetical protein
MMAELVVETNEKEALEKEKQISLQESKVEMQLKPTHHTSTPWTIPVVHGGSAALSASSKDLILVEMMNQTHQEKDVRIRCCMHHICRMHRCQITYTKLISTYRSATSTWSPPTGTSTMPLSCCRVWYAELNSATKYG